MVTTTRETTRPGSAKQSVSGDGRRAGIYVRISQDRTGLEAGVRRQERECRELAERLGWQVAEYYADNGVSAYNVKRRRPEYERMKADLESGRIDAVVAWHPDRLYRRAKELEAVIDLISETKVKVATVQTGDVDLASPNGRLVARIGASVAQHESEHKSERVKAWHRERARAGKPNGGLRPFGYRPDRVTIDEAEAALIREAAARRLAGDSFHTIVTDWNARGLRTVTGRKWTVTSLGGVMRGPRIAGLRQHAGSLHDAVWPPIVAREDWEAICAMRKDNGVRGRPPKHLLTGFVWCGGTHRDGTPCDARLSTSHAGARATGKLRTYACAGAQSHYHGCGRVAAHAEKVEEVVVDRMLGFFDRSPLQEVVAARAGSDETSRELLATLANLEDRLDKLEHEYFVEELLSKPRFLKLRSELKDRIAEVTSQLESTGQVRAVGRMPVGLGDLRAWWLTASVEDRRKVLALVIDRIVVHPVSKRGGNVFDEERVEVMWKTPA